VSEKYVARSVLPSPSESAAACDRLLRAGVPVNNQTVLLRGINDSVETITKLCHKLLKAKVRPYYLFQCDEVQGTEHLRTPVQTGIKIIEGMRGYTSGLAIPTSWTWYRAAAKCPCSPTTSYR
jgi:lysine 2,3-aminomutase